MSGESKVVGLNGLPVPSRQVDPVMIDLLEGALVMAREGKLAGVGIVTLTHDRVAHTAFHVQAGYLSELLGVISVLKRRFEDNILEG